MIKKKEKKSDQDLQKNILSALRRKEGSAAFNTLLFTNLGPCPFPCCKKRWGERRERSLREYSFHMSHIKSKKRKTRGFGIVT